MRCAGAAAGRSPAPSPRATGWRSAPAAAPATSGACPAATAREPISMKLPEAEEFHQRSATISSSDDQVKGPLTGVQACRLFKVENKGPRMPVTGPRPSDQDAKGLAKVCHDRGNPCGKVPKSPDLRVLPEGNACGMCSVGQHRGSVLPGCTGRPGMAARGVIHECGASVPGARAGWARHAMRGGPHGVQRLRMRKR